MGKITQKEIIMAFFKKKHPKKDIHHPEIVDWALLNTKKEQEAYLEILIDRLGAFTKRVF